jgi:hypothetical protein
MIKYQITFYFFVKMLVGKNPIIFKISGILLFPDCGIKNHHKCCDQSELHTYQKAAFSKQTWTKTKKSTRFPAEPAA